jgi:hypothetical protein
MRSVSTRLTTIFVLVEESHHVVVHQIGGSAFVVREVTVMLPDLTSEEVAALPTISSEDNGPLRRAMSSQAELVIQL